MNRLESIRSMALEKRQQLCAELHVFRDPNLSPKKWNPYSVNSLSVCQKGVFKIQMSYRSNTFSDVSLDYKDILGY